MMNLNPTVLGESPGTVLVAIVVRLVMSVNVAVPSSAEATEMQQCES